MTAAVVERPRRGGRPRDPEVTRRALVAGRMLLATGGLSAFTADAIAADAHVGKAALYRRWRTLEQLLADVVEQLGVRPIDHGPGQGTVLADVSRVLHAATTGRDARAELAVLSAVAGSEVLRKAYLAGPLTRLIKALNVAEIRARRRGETHWPSLTAPLAGFRLLQHQVLVGGEEPSMADVGNIVTAVVLPSLGRES
jgi:AcrR family transcriptional regulator